MRRPVHVLAGGALSLLALTACAEQDPVAPATGKPTLTVEQVAYDCATRTLIVLGRAAPPRAGQDVQVQVRSVERPRAPVWRIVATDEAGQMRAIGTYPIAAGESLELNVKLASVVGGARIFSPTTSRPVTCPQSG